MTDTIEEDHIGQVLAALAANVNLVHVFRSTVDNPTPDPPWVLVYPSVAWTRDGIGTALTGRQVTCTASFICHCVGLTDAAALVVAMQVRTSLLNLQPVIAGRSCGPVKQDTAETPIRDDSTGRVLMDAVSTYSYISTG